jgi:chromate reductase
VARRILLVSGSLRAASANTAVLRTIAATAGAGFACRLYDGLARLPAFNPDDDHHPLPVAVQELRDDLHWSQAVLFSTPEYAGALPGSLKNLLDWTIGDEHPGSIYAKPVAWVNTSPRGAEGAHDELRVVLGYAHARIVTSACAHLPVAPAMIGADGLVSDDSVRAALPGVLAELGAAIAGTGSNPLG